ncbi:MAG TPA: hypothetical protein VFI34_10775 [Candidatus Limnocylindrales bacterium]|nr:hypothetical protein [Candidatus Limnocylindrales bacterium]
MVCHPGTAIDRGSTSVHLLVARIEAGGLVVLDDGSTFLGLGAAVDGPGSLDGPVGPPSWRRSADTSSGYVQRARDRGDLDRVGVAIGRIVGTGLCEGAIVADARGSDPWRDQLEELAGGWVG